jgi:hypothetical protein
MGRFARASPYTVATHEPVALQASELNADRVRGHTHVAREVLYRSRTPPQEREDALARASPVVLWL